MKLASPFVLGLAFLAAPTAAQSGRPERVRPPELPRRSGFVAARNLTELEPAASLAGVFATGDLDGDGDVDLLTLEWPTFFWDPTGIQTWTNDGQGAFTPTHLLAFDPWDRALIELADQVFLADVTGDGVLDLAYDRNDTRGIVPSGVLVHPGLGDGSFGAELLIPTHGRPFAFLVGDADGDGDADVLVHDTRTATEDRHNLTWWHLENGAFVPGTPLVFDGNLPLRISALDADGDGITDILGGTFTTVDALQVFLTENLTPVLAATVPLASTLHDGNQRHRASDIDGDGNTDLLVVLEDLDLDLFHLQVFLGDGSGTSFQPMPLQSLANPDFERPYSRDSELADWDGDGDLDLVSPSFAWLENVGLASFEPAGRQYSSWTGNGNRSPLHVVDLDLDGHLDALAHRMVFAGDGTMPRRTSGPAYLGTSSTFWLRVEDWDGDGDLDLSSYTSVQLNNGDGTFVQLSTPLERSGSIVAWGDFDGDALRDVLLSVSHAGVFQEMVLLVGTQDGPYVSASVVPSAVAMPVGSLSGDLDGDGDQDVLASGGYWPNDGTGRFASPVAAYQGTPLLARDGDSDGDLDLLVSHLGDAWYLENLGGLVFQGTDLGPYDASEPPALLDVDQDGDLDFVVGRTSLGIVEVRGQLASGFGAPLELEAPGLNGPVGVGDVDGDGRVELLASRRAPLNIAEVQLLVAWRRGAGLTYDARTEWATRNPALWFADFDGDGDVDARGVRTVQSLLFDGPGDGSAVQYGLDAATAGSGGRRPLLGSRGPARTTAHLALAHGRGRAAGILLVGEGRTDVVDGGYRRLVDLATVARTFTLNGRPGIAGVGSLTLPLPVDVSLYGRTLDFQAVLVDPQAPSGLSATNGLEVRFGDRPGS